MVQATLDCNREWVDFRATIPGPESQNCHRLDTGLTSKPPSLDNINETDNLWHESCKYIQGESIGRGMPYLRPEFTSAYNHVHIIAARLLSSLFYLGDALDKNMRKGSLKGTIYCRLAPQSDGAVNLLASRPILRLKEVSSSNDEIIHHVRFINFNMFNETMLSDAVELEILEGGI
jgi:hypothetical protein